MTFRLIQGGLSTRESGRPSPSPDGPLPGLLVVGVAEIATLAGGLRTGAELDHPAAIRAGVGGADPFAALGAPAVADILRPLAARAGDLQPGEPEMLAVACWEGRIAAVGSRSVVQLALELAGLPLEEFAVLEADGGTVTPGLVDAHTHLVFAGTREDELVLRQRGASYLEILAAGGGILSTVAATREASTDELLAHGRRWLAEMLSHGTTTLEAKSGYGLDLATELRLLEVSHRLGVEGPIDILPTWLGAHAVPPEFRGRPNGTEAYVRHLIEEQLPGVVAQGRARFADVFCEAGVFTADQSRRVLEAASRLGLGIRLHADELAPSGGAELAAELGALSADHLAAPSDAGIDALAEAAAAGRPVVATLLPATMWYLMHDHGAPARRLIERGVPIALASDFNPGTSPTPNLALVMTIGCLELGLTPSEVLAATTINAAHALGLGDEIGSLEPGKAADLVVWRVPTHRQIPTWPGANLVQAVVKRGRVVLERD